MTFENSKRLYEHYLKIGRKGEAEDLVKKYPNLVKHVKPIEKPKVEEKKEVEKDK